MGRGPQHLSQPTVQFRVLVSTAMKLHCLPKRRTPYLLGYSHLPKKIVAPYSLSVSCNIVCFRQKLCTALHDKHHRRVLSCPSYAPTSLRLLPIRGGFCPFRFEVLVAKEDLKFCGKRLFM